MLLFKTLQAVATQTGGRLRYRESSTICHGVDYVLAAPCNRSRNAALFRLQDCLWTKDVNNYRTKSAASRSLSAIRFQCSSKNVASTVHGNNAVAETPDKLTPESSTCLLTLPLGTREVVNVGDIAERLGVRLTECEKKLLQKRLDFDEDGIVTSDDFAFASRKALEDRTMRELCLQVIEQPTTPVATWGTRFVKLMDYIGVALFSVVGTQVAGDAGFNLVGCTLVGCVAGLGGRSINNLLYGTSSPLLRQLPGVFWARKPLYLAIAIASSAVTFFVWPVYCNAMSSHYLEKVIGRENLEADGSVGRDAFVRACEHDIEFLEVVRSAMLPTMKKRTKKLDSGTPDEIFRSLDVDGSGTIDSNELKSLVQGRFHNSWEMYTIDTAALAAVTVAGVHGAISMGLHPLVAATSGIVMSLGGVLRDLFCSRDLAMASQSYAFATGAGSTVYVLTREMALRGYPLLAVTRIFLSMGTTVSIRCWEYFRGEPLLSPMHGRK